MAGPVLPNPNFAGRVYEVDGDESSDSARAPISLSPYTLPSDAAIVLDSRTRTFSQDVTFDETPTRARHPTSDPSRDGSTGS